jgi:hypothetical protein
MFLAPKTQTISFFGTVALSSNVTLISGKLTSAFKVKRIRASFPSGVNRLMRLRFYIVGTPDTPTASPPIGTDLLSSVGQVNFITGDDNVIEFDHEIMSPDSNKFIAIFAENADVFEHTIECQVTIEYLDLEPNV